MSSTTLTPRDKHMPKNYNMYVNRFHPGATTNHVTTTNSTIPFTWDGETPFKAHDVLTAIFSGSGSGVPLKDGIPSECIICGEGMSKSNRDQWTFLIDWFHSPIPEFVNVWIQDINVDVQKDLERRQLDHRLEGINKRAKELENERASLEFQKEQILDLIWKAKGETPRPPRPAQDPALTNKQRIGVVGESG